MTNLLLESCGSFRAGKCVRSFSRALAFSCPSGWIHVLPYILQTYVATSVAIRVFLTNSVFLYFLFPVAGFSVYAWLMCARGHVCSRAACTWCTCIPVCTRMYICVFIGMRQVLSTRCAYTRLSVAGKSDGAHARFIRRAKKNSRRATNLTENGQTKK